MGRDGLDSYIIRGGEKGRARLSVLAGVLAPKTGQLLDQFGSLSGQTVIDVGCGGGDVSFELATRVGPDGKVHGLDLDEEKLAIVRAEAEERGIAHLSFHSADVAKPWPVGDAQFVYARFILTHVTEPAAILRQAFKALDAGGTIVVEDIDMGAISATRHAGPSIARVSSTSKQGGGAAPILSSGAACGGSSARRALATWRPRCTSPLDKAETPNAWRR